MLASMAASDSVLGHYMQQGKAWQPLLPESSALFCDVVADKLIAVEAAVDADLGKLNHFFLLLHWASDVSPEGNGKAPSPEDNGRTGAQTADNHAKASVNVKHRTLLMIAAYHGSLRVLSYLLSKGAEPGRKAPDGVTAYDLALAGEAPQVATALAMMRDADTYPSSSKHSSASTEHTFNTADGMRMNSQDLEGTEGCSYSTSDLTRPEYATDDFRMFNFKVLRCSKRHAHDWRACPFAHPTENARRRDPREFRYCALACPDYKQGFCIRGDVCPYAHGVFECWLHPSRYRTQLCKDGATCHRPVCFFAHSLPELRAPTFTWVPGPEDLARLSGGLGGLQSPSQGATMALTKLPSSGLQGTSQGSPALQGSAPACAAGALADVPLPMAPLPSNVLPRSPSDSTPAAGVHQDDYSVAAAAVATVSPSLSAGGAAPSCGASGLDSMLSGTVGGNGSHTPGSPSSSNMLMMRQDSKDGSLKGLHSVSANLTQPNSAAVLLGFTAPRMSNAFARRHGLNPKDNPMLNLQKIALQQQVVTQVGPSPQAQTASPQHQQQTAHSVSSSSNRSASSGSCMQQPLAVNGIAAAVAGSYADPMQQRVHATQQQHAKATAAANFSMAASQAGMIGGMPMAATNGRTVNYPTALLTANGAMGANPGAASMGMAQSAYAAQQGAYALGGYTTAASPSAMSYGLTMVSPAGHMASAQQSAADPNQILAMQLAQLNLHQQRGHMGHMAMTHMGMAGMAAGAAAAAGMAAAAAMAPNMGPYLTTTHQAMLQQGGYAGHGAYDPHLMSATMGATQAEAM